jgi:prepilin-type N-terminal cleavage/methylation domain-containing protein
MDPMPRYAFSAMRRLRLHGEAGYSLVEMMTVLMVVGILLAIAAPTIQSHIALQEMRGAAREVVEVLRDARDSAVNEGVPRYVVFVPPRTYQVWRYEAPWRMEEEEILPGSVSFSDADTDFPALAATPEAGASVPEDAAYFDTRGRYPFLAGAPGSYTLTLHGGLDKQVVLTVYRSTGQVTGL